MALPRRSSKAFRIGAAPDAAPPDADADADAGKTQDVLLPGALNPPPAPVKTPSGASESQRVTLMRGDDEPAPRPVATQARLEMPAKRRSLALKLPLFTLLVIVFVGFLFGVFFINNHRKYMLDDAVRSGIQDVRVLQIFGQRVINDVKGDGANFNLARLADYEKTKRQSDQELLRQIKDSDPRMIDLAIFASADPAERPATPVVCAEKYENFNALAMADVKLPDGSGGLKVYRCECGAVPCLLIREPLLEAPGGKMFASANVLISTEAIGAETARLTYYSVVVGLVVAGAGIAMSLALGLRMAQRIHGLADDIESVSSGDLDHESRIADEADDEFGLLGTAFNHMVRGLRDARERELERERERMAREIHTAQAIHAELLPAKRPELPGIDIDTAYYCAKEVGGDYYDFIPVDGVEHLAFVVADVSGKGIPGSMVMGQMRTIVRMAAVNNLSAADVLLKTNQHLARGIKRGMFVTCMYAILNLRTREMTVASAGHNPMLIWRAATRTIEKVRPDGIALGFDKGPVFNRVVKEQKLKLLSGDRVVLYTDGVVEAMNEKRDEWGDDALDAFTLKCAPGPSHDFVRLLCNALAEHQGRAEQHDDITVLTFKFA